MNFNDFGIDSASMAGSLETRLSAARQAGFTHAMISATDIVGHPVEYRSRRPAIRNSGLRVTGLEALRDFEGSTASCTTTRSTSPNRCCSCAAGSAAACCSPRPHHRSTPTSTRTRSPATCASSPSWRCRWASASPSRVCPGAARSATSPPPPRSFRWPTARTSAWPWMPSTSSPPAFRSTTST
jgi:hypothetical protein